MCKCPHEAHLSTGKLKLRVQLDDLWKDHPNANIFDHYMSWCIQNNDGYDAGVLLAVRACVINQVAERANRSYMRPPSRRTRHVSVQFTDIEWNFLICIKILSLFQLLFHCGSQTRISAGR